VLREMELRDTIPNQSEIFPSYCGNNTFPPILLEGVENGLKIAISNIKMLPLLTWNNEYWPRC
jgi:hypothetical protein